MGNLCITFDDIDGSVYQNAFPIFKKYNVPATFFVCGKLVLDKFKGKYEGYPPVSIAQLKEMYDAGWEIGNHTYSHAYLTKITLSKVTEEIKKNVQFLNKNKIYSLSGFSYPWGVYTDEIINIVKKYHTYARATVGTKPSGQPGKYRLNAVVLAAKTKLCDVLKRIEKRFKTDKTLILFAHRIHDSFDGYTWPTGYLESVIKYAVDNGVKVTTMGDIYAT